eukprot:ANDGO_04758.mRNA.1 Elongin-C
METEAAVKPSLTLLTQDGFEILIAQDLASYSKVLQAFLAEREASGAAESPNAAFSIPFRSDLVERAIQYLHYKKKWDHEPDERPQFPIDPESALQLILVADFLQI